MDEIWFDKTFPSHCFDVDCVAFVDHINPKVIALFKDRRFSEYVFINYRLAKNPSELILKVTIKFSPIGNIIFREKPIHVIVNVFRDLNVFHFFRLL